MMVVKLRKKGLRESYPCLQGELKLFGLLEVCIKLYRLKKEFVLLGGRGGLCDVSGKRLLLH